VNISHFSISDMNRITLTQDGSIVENSRIAEADPLVFLSFAVELGNDYSLRSYFRMFEKYALLTKLNAFFPSYLEQYRSSPKNNCVYDAFDYLEFGKTVEMIGFPGKPRLEIYHSLRGICGTETCEIRSVPLENLLDMPVKLGKLRHIVFGDKVDVFGFDTVFNLFEFIDGIVWELSFQGTLMACALRR
jgi:hypothetical protein